MEIYLITTFVIGYCFIIFEKNMKVDKAAFALLTGVLCWVIYAFNSHDSEEVNRELSHHISEISAILFFLLGAMTIVEMIDAHNGFEVITSRLTSRSKRKLLWLVVVLSFFLSAVLDNLTTAIVMTTLCAKLFSEKKDRWMVLGLVIIAANAGGAWSPIGDVTTTMLWMGEKITALGVMKSLIIPSILCAFVPTLIASFLLKGNLPTRNEEQIAKGSDFEGKLVFISGIAGLLLVPVFKSVTGLPPYMAILFSLGCLWFITEMLHKKKSQEEKEKLSVVRVLQRVDVPSILFFLGILAAVAVLQSTGILIQLAEILSQQLKSDFLIASFIGLLSAIVDNVPLLAASMGMYGHFPSDHEFWKLIAFTTGTGGSCLIIGSAAGVAVMGIEKIDFIWYFKRISLLALLGYFSGLLYLFFFL